jgi:zinc transport system substrate-binding protein
VAVSVLPQRSFVEKIAGDRVRVEVMIPPGANPATHEPGVEQLRWLSRAILYVKVGHPGFPFEAAWLDRLLADHPGLEVVDTGAGLGARAGDPHLWVSPRRAAAMAEAIAAALIRALPAERDAFQANLARFSAEVDALDAEIGRILAPHRGERFLVVHPAWGYLAEDYGLQQVALEPEGKEPDAGTLARRIREARAAGVQVVFAQPHFDDAAARVVADEIGARVEMLDPLAPAWGENLLQVAHAVAAGAVP